MHILDLSSIYPNEAIEYEGRSVASLDRALASTGCKITTFVMKQWIPLCLARRIPRFNHLAVRDRTFVDEGVEVIFTHFPYLPRFVGDSRFEVNVNLMAEKALRIYRRLGLSIDIIHAQGITAGLAAALVANRLNVPFALTLRDDLGHLLDGGVPIHFLYRRMFSLASAVFAIGPSQMRDAPKLFTKGSEPRLILAPNGVDFADLEALIGPSWESEKEFTGKIVSVSSLVRYKGIHENLMALKRLLERNIRQWYYVIVGDGPYRKELEQLVADSDLSDYVNFAGRLSHVEALRTIREAHIFCLPSFMEAFGNVFTEAAFCGVPAIGCLGGGAELIIKDGETGFLVPPRNIDAIADAIALLLNHPEKCRQMGNAARSHIRQFSWARTAEVYNNTFSHIINEKRFGPGQIYEKIIKK